VIARLIESEKLDYKFEVDINERQVNQTGSRLQGEERRRYERIRFE
jgi:hypothetical protein